MKIKNLDVFGNKGVSITDGNDGWSYQHKGHMRIRDRETYLAAYDLGEANKKLAEAQREVAEAHEKLHNQCVQFPEWDETTSITVMGRPWGHNLYPEEISADIVREETWVWSTEKLQDILGKKDAPTPPKIVKKMMIEREVFEGFGQDLKNIFAPALTIMKKPIKVKLR